MKENENINIDDLLLSEKNYRESGEYNECLDVCIKILNTIKSTSTNPFDIISKLFLYPNQSNYVRIHLMHILFQDNNFINSIKIKKKYYQLFIDSLKNDKSKDLLKQKNDIINLYEKCNLDNFDELDKYIVNFVSTPTPLSTLSNEDFKEKFETEKIFIIEEKDIRRNKSSICNTFLETSLSSSAKRLDQDNLLPQSTIQTSFEEMTTNRQDINISIQKIMPESEQKKKGN